MFNRYRWFIFIATGIILIGYVGQRYPFQGLSKPEGSTTFQGILKHRTKTAALSADPTNIIPPLPPGILTEPTFVNGRQFLVMGAVELEAFDQSGNRTGRGPLEGVPIEENADQTSFTGIGDTKSIFVRGSGIYTFHLKATEVGVFDLRLRTVRESVVERFVLFADVPFSSANAIARLVYNADETKPQDRLEVDQDGDGVYETTLLPTSDIEGESVNDQIAPTTVIHLSGRQIGENRFLGPVQVTLEATDNPGGAGVAKVEYTLDGGATVNQYTDPFTISAPGTTTIEVRATDKAGNIEAPPATVQIVSVLEITIDIQPGGSPNSINCNNRRGEIPVAILTTDTFDARTVDHTTVIFEGARESHVDRRTGQPIRHEEDVGEDGDIDLMFHFRLSDTALTCSSTQGTLIGSTFAGLPIQGTDSVRMIPGAARSLDEELSATNVFLPLVGNE